MEQKNSKKFFKRNVILIILGVILLILLVIFLITYSGNKSNPPQTANPASVYCKERGYQYEIVTNDSGQYGVCILNESIKCEEWSFFRGECELK